jgi:hypothetical protein
LKTQLLRVQILIVACLILFSPQTGEAYGQPEPQRPQAGAESKSGSGGSPRTERVGPEVIIYGDDDYNLAPRDVIGVIVEDAPELSVNYTVSSKGIIPLRFLGAAQVTGKTTDEVSKIIADGRGESAWAVSTQTGNHIAPGHFARGRDRFQRQARQRGHLPHRPDHGKFHRTACRHRRRDERQEQGHADPWQ